jgi:hypothetical protein
LDGPRKRSADSYDYLPRLNSLAIKIGSNSISTIQCQTSPPQVGGNTEGIREADHSFLHGKDPYCKLKLSMQSSRLADDASDLESATCSCMDCHCQTHGPNRSPQKLLILKRCRRRDDNTSNEEQHAMSTELVGPSFKEPSNLSQVSTMQQRIHLPKSTTPLPSILQSPVLNNKSPDQFPSRSDDHGPGAQLFFTWRGLPQPRPLW